MSEATSTNSGTNANVNAKVEFPKSNLRKLNADVGLSKFPDQMRRKSLKKGFNFTLMVVGEYGVGKSTLINTIFESQIFPPKDYSIPNKFDAVDIKPISAEIVENGILLNLTVVDTPGFGDLINNQHSYESIIKCIDSRFDSYLEQEMVMRKQKINDQRIDALLYFIRPTGHNLRPFDIEFMKKVHTKVNLIPIISKSDTLSKKEINGFKSRIMNDINSNGIQIFKPAVDIFDSQESTLSISDITSKIPFAVVGSQDFVKDSSGMLVRGKQLPWGVVEVENENHNDFVKLRKMLVSAHMLELKSITDSVLYENYRSQKLLMNGYIQDNSVFREYDPIMAKEEELKRHKYDMEMMEIDMTKEFERKVEEKELKLKENEEELYIRYKRMKNALDLQIKELKEQKDALEAKYGPLSSIKKKGIFGL
ncbi:hypothetical protein BB558_001969 [Smittium angustum]|uniref:Septin-type G domain-containing protein n=1 Tax=Smittium angustum TaxID=133377 RepID=A0A2U1J9Z8_SMIAN|nr:hypothetical protein BB558_001969 [Smittium angustum]